MKTPQSRHVSLCNCFALRKAARSATQLYEDMLEPTGLRITQYLSLVAIGEMDGISINALAVELDLDKTTMGKNLLPLERRGLVKVSRAERDARAKEIRLTQAGREALQDAMPLWEKAQQALEARLDGALTALRSTLPLVSG